MWCGVMWCGVAWCGVVCCVAVFATTPSELIGNSFRSSNVHVAASDVLTSRTREIADLRRSAVYTNESTDCGDKRRANGVV